MIPLTLRYRALTTDPWITVPDLTSAFPALPVGAVPVHSVRFSSEPEVVIPGVCSSQSWLPVPGGSSEESFLILRAATPPIPLAFESDLLTFLIHYKTAAYQEAQYDRYGLGGFISASLSQIDVKERNGSLELSFRLAAAMADALTNV